VPQALVAGALGELPGSPLYFTSQLYVVSVFVNGTSKSLPELDVAGGPATTGWAPLSNSAPPEQLVPANSLKRTVLAPPSAAKPVMAATSWMANFWPVTSDVGFFPTTDASPGSPHAVEIVAFWVPLGFNVAIHS
jgi:hypothetical protein